MSHHRWPEPDEPILASAAVRERRAEIRADLQGSLARRARRRRLVHAAALPAIALIALTGWALLRPPNSLPPTGTTPIADATPEIREHESAPPSSRVTVWTTADRSPRLVTQVRTADTPIRRITDRDLLRLINTEDASYGIIRTAGRAILAEIGSEPTPDRSGGDRGASRDRPEPSPFAV